MLIAVAYIALTETLLDGLCALAGAPSHLQRLVWRARRRRYRRRLERAWLAAFSSDQVVVLPPPSTAPDLLRAPAGCPEEKRIR